ncbi:MAG TPA: hypothetical protein VFZ37_01655 [Jiangellaceae bacterium]
MGMHAYVDESKKRDYLVAAVVVPAEQVADARRAMRELLTGHQQRIHFRDERPSRKERVVATVLDVSVDCRVYVSRSRHSARENCLNRLVPDLTDSGVERLVLETDTSTEQLDRRTLYAATRKAGSNMIYVHHSPHQEPLLWAPDAIAWCWAAGGKWRRLIRPQVREIEAG